MMRCNLESCNKRARIACSECRAAFYCAAPHQVEHWERVHRYECYSGEEEEDEVMMVAQAGKRREKEEEDEEEPGHLAKRESCPRDIAEESKQVIREEMQDLTDEDFKAVEKDAELNTASAKILYAFQEMHSLCSDYMEPEKIQIIILKLRQKNGADVEWHLPELFKGINEYHAAFMEAVRAPQPATEERVRRLGYHVSQIIESFLEFYKAFCPYMNAFAEGKQEFRDRLYKKISSIINEGLNPRVAAAKKEFAQWAITGDRPAKGMYGMMDVVYKLMSWRAVVVIVMLGGLLPYVDEFLMSEYTNQLVHMWEKRGYTVPTELFEYRSENLLGFRGFTNSLFSWYATVPSISSYIPSSVRMYVPLPSETAPMVPNPWAQTGINALFTVGIYAGYLGRALKSILSGSVSFMCSQIFSAMGFSPFASAIAGNVASYLICANLLVGVPALWRWYKGFKNSKGHQEMLQELNDSYVEFNKRAYEATKNQMSVQN